MADPRLYQIATLAVAARLRDGWLDFDITVGRVVLLLATVSRTQAIGDRLVGGRRSGPARQRADLRAVAVPAAARPNRAELAVLAAVIAIAGKFVDPIPRQARLQPDQRRHRRDAAADATGRGCRPASGARSAFFALPHGVPRRPRRQPRRARLTSRTRSSSVYCALLFGRSLLSGRADDDSAAPTPERRTAAVHLLHDFRSEDDAGFARSGACCSPRSSPSVRGTCSSGCSGPTASSGRWPRARRWSRSSIGCCPAAATRGPASQSCRQPRDPRCAVA